MDCLKSMWTLQNIEVEMVQLRKEWAHVKDLIEKEARSDLEQIQAGIESARDQWQEIKAQYDDMVAEIESINRKLNQYNQQLYVEGGQSKELISFQQSIDKMEKRKAVLEESQLNSIEQLDQLEKKIANETCRFQRLDEQRKSRSSRLRQRKDEISEAYQKMKKEREELRASIPGYMMAIYNDLVAQKKRPMAVLRGENCGGCGMAQTVLNVNALKKGGHYTRCSNCGRILVLDAEVHEN